MLHHTATLLIAWLAAGYWGFECSRFPVGRLAGSLLAALGSQVIAIVVLKLAHIV